MTEPFTPSDIEASIAAKQAIRPTVDHNGNVTKQVTYVYDDDGRLVSTSRDVAVE